MTQPIDRRQWMIGATTLAATLSATARHDLRASDTSLASELPTKPTFRYCLNTSTLRGQKLPLAEEVRIAAEAGYTGIEPWIREIKAHQENGGSLGDLKKQIADSGLVVESAIGFSNWIVDDKKKRTAALEQA